MSVFGKGVLGVALPEVCVFVCVRVCVRVGGCARACACACVCVCAHAHAFVGRAAPLLHVRIAVAAGNDAGTSQLDVQILWPGKG
eukprot:1158133-Pelagomonas_calceolata.AAC.5